VFPLYVYSDAEKRDLFAALESTDRRSNLNAKLMEKTAAAYGWEPTPETALHYIFAVLCTPTYRARYAEFLRRDFPRTPFTSSSTLFAQVAAIGQHLVELHLLRAPELDTPIAHFEGQGDGVVGRGRTTGLRFDEDSCRVYVNAAQYFAPVPADVWEYQIGGYQVCAKWLKDREGRHLELDDIRTYCRIVTALQRTIELQKELDELYPSIEENLLQLEL